MKYLIIVASLFSFLQSCSQTKKTSGSHANILPELPYQALDKKLLDTTFDYQVLEKTLDFALPDSLFGIKTTGSVGFYSMINADRQVVDIKMISGTFFRNNEIVYTCNENKISEQSDRLKNYLLTLMQTIPFKQNKPVTLEQHPTYCFIRFYK